MTCLDILNIIDQNLDPILTVIQLAPLNWLMDNWIIFLSPKLHKQVQRKSTPFFWITGSIFRVTDHFCMKTYSKIPHFAQHMFPHFTQYVAQSLITCSNTIQLYIHNKYSCIIDSHFIIFFNLGFFVD